MYTFTNSPVFVKRAAGYYRSNVKNPADVVILRLTAPQRLTRPRGRTWELKYGDNWRKMICTSRKTEKFKNDWEYWLRGNFQRSEVIIGPILTDVGEGTTGEAVNNLNLFRILPEGKGIAEPAVVIQHVFNGSYQLLGMKDERLVALDLYKYCGPGKVQWLADQETWTDLREQHDPSSIQP